MALAFKMSCSESWGVFHIHQERDGAPLLQGKAGRIGIIHPGEEKASGEPTEKMERGFTKDLERQDKEEMALNCQRAGWILAIDNLNLLPAFASWFEFFG